MRVPFPCDVYNWAESPFMTNMLKLAPGQPLYGPPGELNSFVYSPGLPYLAYALLAPFGLALRSEEHPSELPSLMRIPYAVFCLTKKNNATSQPTEQTTH